MGSTVFGSSGHLVVVRYGAGVIAKNVGGMRMSELASDDRKPTEWNLVLAVQKILRDNWEELEGFVGPVEFMGAVCFPTKDACVQVYMENGPHFRLAVKR